jgi:hypothetical protein
MAQYVRRRAASIQLGFAAGALGLLAGIGLGRGTEPPPTVDAEPAAKKTITITGSNIVNGSVKYQDLNKASIQKGIYLKAQTDRLFLKLSAADARFHKVITNALGGYIKLGDADTRYLKLDALNGYLKLTDADARFLKLDALDSYVKLDTADGRFLKLNALDGYLKLDAADARFLKLDTADARYIKLGALDGYVKLDALNGYLKLDALNGYLKTADAEAQFVKGEALADYIKGEDADARYVEGDGSVRTASQLATAEHQTLVVLGKTMAMDDWDDGQGRGVNVQIKNLSEGTISYASTSADAQGGPAHGMIDQGGSSPAILIGLLQPTTLQVVDRGDGSVHTLTITAFDKGDGKPQITAQALSGAPPAR